MRLNARRSGCPINLTLEALGDRWSEIGALVGLSGNTGNKPHLHLSIQSCDPVSLAAGQRYEALF